MQPISINTASCLVIYKPKTNQELCAARRWLRRKGYTIKRLAPTIVYEISVDVPNKEYQYLINRYTGPYQHTRTRNLSGFVNQVTIRE